MNNRKLQVLIFFVVIIVTEKLQAQEFIPLWPSGKKPNNNGKKITDSLFNERIWRVATPGIYVFPVPKSENKGSAVLICPGGGYERLSHIYNGFQVARWFNVHGINAFVLIYRLPHQADLQNRELGPLQDAQRAMKLIRGNASRYFINLNTIGVMGTSAGGHLASSLGNSLEDISMINDSLDKISYRPDFMILLSPVISMGQYAHMGSRKNLLGPDSSNSTIEKYSNELHVSASTPPTFIVHAQNDSTVPVMNSLLFYHALIEKKVAASIHIFPQGGHGIKMFDNPGSTDLWTELLYKWLIEKGFVATSKY
jgi:acetyl esterase/lipase